MEDDDGDYGTFLNPKPRAVPPDRSTRKWLTVAILALLSGLNQGICYSYAPIASIAEARWEQHVPPFVVHDAGALPAWNLGIAGLAAAAGAVAYATFQSFPASVLAAADAESIVSDVQLQDEYDWTQWGNAFAHDGFWNTVAAFSVAECVLNAMAALLGKFLSTDGFSKPQVGVIGAAFVVSSLVGGQIISQCVDRRRAHKRAMQLCLLLTAAALAAFKLSLSASVLATFASLMAVGAFLGPLQPIVLELGVECAFPTSEATVAALQQLCGNFLSALLVPGLSVLRRTHTDATGHVPGRFFYASPEWIMIALLLVTFVAFCFYNGQYKRFDHEAGILRPEALQTKGTSSRLPSFVAVTIKPPAVNEPTASLPKRS
ncbi:hypothetical protein PybrP1_008617 [[Pythium] brassicae (nom. inval.)]|nr:hypothetical protein PybrP1_008617 [[Pythium] brassicae (nom. inval.)]